MNYSMLTALAPAKLNLYLHITGKRPDGYHLLDSLVTFLDFGDEVTVAPSEILELSVTGALASAIPAQADNLVLRAARLLQQHAGISHGANISLNKHLPVGAGLGGGSSDAAVTLLLLNQLWELNYTKEQLRGLAASLGADIPACITQETLYMSGIGEVIEPAPQLPDCFVLLVNPRVPLPTPDVYRAFEWQGEAVPRPSLHVETVEALAESLRHTTNDLEGAARSICPQIAEMLECLYQQDECLLARLCGSGATCFGLFADERTMKDAQQKMAHHQPDWWVQPTSIRR